MEFQEGVAQHGFGHEFAYPFTSKNARVVMALHPAKRKQAAPSFSRIDQIRMR